MKHEERSIRLREALRRGDPAANEAGLTTEEAQAVRRAMLSAAPAPRRRFLPAPVFATLAGTAAVALSLAVAVGLWRSHESTPPPVQPVPPAARALPAPPVAAAAPMAPMAPMAPRIAEPRREPARVARAVRRAPVRRPARREAAPDQTVLAANATDGATEKPAVTATRQVQFSTPGGTRIIWLLPEKTR
jgi:hypothetical protein